MSHIKRLSAPRSWSLKRKSGTWTTSTKPGAHPKSLAMSMTTLIRDVLGYVDTAAEARKIIAAGDITIDGKKSHDYQFPIGLMDVIGIEKTKEHYRVLLDRRGRLRLAAISPEEAAFKFLRIENKTSLKGGSVQLNLSSGKNIIVSAEEAKKYTTGDVLKFELATKKIADCYQFKEGNTALITRGKHTGEIAAISAVEIAQSSESNIVSLKGAGGNDFSTRRENVFVIGREKPEIQVPEVSVI